MKKVTFWTVFMLCTVVIIQLAFSLGENSIKPIRIKKPYAEVDPAPWYNFNTRDFTVLKK